MAKSRREFLKAGAAAFALAAWPGLRRAFADASIHAGDHPDDLAAALERARKNHRAVLVLVIPENDEQKYDRGRQLGIFLNHATDEELAPFAQVDVVCATMVSVRRADPSAGWGEPLMVLFDPSSPSARPIDPPLKRVLIARVIDDRDADQLITANLRRIAVAVREALPKVAAADVPRLAAEAKRRLRKGAPRGSRWADATGCGAIIEGEKADGPQPACGMGHVPEKARRFLDFFAPAPKHAKTG
jgi:hypothetical protein